MRRLKRWLQERQYARPYHWHMSRANELEYALRSRVVLELAGLSGHGNGHRPRLLDLGCGDGRFSATATEHATVTGTDYSPRAVGYAQRLVPHARFVASSGTALPFADRSFDIVTLLDVIEHIPDDEEMQVIAEARRVLRPGGALVISTNTDRSATELKHFRHYPIPRFEQLFSGLSDLRLVGVIPYAPTQRFWMALPFTARLLESRLRTCAPDQAHVVVGAAIRPDEDANRRRPAP